MSSCKVKDFVISDVSGEKLELGSKFFTITSHKPRETEQLVYQLKLHTPLTKMVTLASKNPLVRGLCFISYGKLWRRNDGEIEQPAPLIFPLGIEDVTKEMISQKIDSTREVAEDIKNTIKGYYEILQETFKASIRQTVQDQVRKSRQRELRRASSVKEIFDEWSEQASKVMKDEMEKRQKDLDRLTRNTESQRMAPDFTYRIMAINEGLEYFSKVFDDYQRIYQHLRDSSGVLKPDEFHYMLRTLSHEEISYGSLLTSVCLQPDCSYSATYYEAIPFSGECSACKGRILSLYRCSIDEYVSSAWELTLLQEMILAYILDEQDWVKKVWLHKAIQQRKNGKFTESIWIDIIVQTKDDRLLFIDVTPQDDLSNIVGELKKKWDKFSSSGVEFDGLICVSSASPLPKYINPVGEAWLLGASHLDKIYSHLEHIYSNEIVKKTSAPP